MYQDMSIFVKILQLNFFNINKIRLCLELGYTYYPENIGVNVNSCVMK